MTLITDLIKQQQEAAGNQSNQAGDIFHNADVLTLYQAQNLISQTATQVVEAVVGMCEAKKDQILCSGCDNELEYCDCTREEIIDDFITTLRAQVSGGDKQTGV